MAACLSGDEQAWSELIDRYNRLIFSIPLKQGLNREEAGDIFQAVCLDLVAELPRLRDPQALPAWLIQTTLHKVSKWRRRNERFVPDEGTHRRVRRPIRTTCRTRSFENCSRRRRCATPSRRCPIAASAMVQMLFFETPARPYKDVAQALGVATGSIGFLRSRVSTGCGRSLEGIGLCR